MNWFLDLLDAIPALWRMVEIKTEEMFLRQLRTYCLQLFRGELGEFAWIDDMSTTIADQMGKAWREGAKAVEVELSEFTDEDNEELNKIIASEYDYVLALGSDILALRLMGGSLEDYRTKFAGRIEVWAHRYTDVVNQAVVWFGKRKKVKLKWEMGATEEHCATCAALNGIVAYAEDWERSGIHPQNPPNQALECGGWRCDCALVPTTERATNNAFDEIVDRVTAAKDGEKSLKYDPNQPRVPAGNSEGGRWVSSHDTSGRSYANIRETENSITNQRREHSFGYNKDGELIAFHTGTKDQTRFTEEELELIRGGYMTHNHPKNTSFSETDLMRASHYNLAEERVVTRDATFIARPPATGWPSPFKMRVAVFNAVERLARHPDFSKMSQLEKCKFVNWQIESLSGITIEVITNE